MPALTRAPRGGRSFWRLVHDRNPFYLLSAVCMFAGCRAIISALGVAPGDGRKLVALVGALQAYEACLVALALFLIRRRGLHRDGWILLGIDALFLVDLTLLTSEISYANLRTGLAVNAACFALALAKVGVVCRVLRLRLPSSHSVLIALQLAAMFGLAGMFKYVARDGAISPAMLYAVWWAVGAIVATWAFVPGRTLADDDPSHPNAFAPLPYRLYAFLGLASLLVHLGGANRVYGVPFHAVNVAPLLLGVAVLVGRSTRLPRSVAEHLQVLLAGVAVVMSLHFPGELTVHALGVDLTPLRCALLGAAAVALFALWRHHRLALASVATACVGTAALGRDIPAMRANLLAALRWLVESARQLVPSTPLEWGVAAVVASFVLLGVGAAISLGKPPAPGTMTSDEL
jgi:hypothetical protein